MHVNEPKSQSFFCPFGSAPPIKRFAMAPLISYIYLNIIIKENLHLSLSQVVGHAEALQEVLKMMEVSCSCIAVVLWRQLSLRNLGQDSHTTSLASSDNRGKILAIRPQRAHWLCCDIKGVVHHGSKPYPPLETKQVQTDLARYY